MTQLDSLQRRARVGPSGRAALELLACCPWMPTDVTASLLRLRHTRSVAQLLRRLARAGLVRYQTFTLGPLVAVGPLRLWTGTPAGLDMVGDRKTSGQHQVILARMPRRAELPMRVAASRLLA